ncbi:MAG: DegV family protein, partial [Candidatus Thorarchaeota archaeon]
YPKKKKIWTPIFIIARNGCYTMRDIAIVTDGSCDLPKELIEKYNIFIIPFKVIFGVEVFKTSGDWGDLTKDDFYNKLQSSRVFPTTAIPPQKDMINVFQEALQSAKNTIGIFLSKEFSGFYNAALLASKSLAGENIFLVDSKVSTSTLGALVLEAAKMAERGVSKDEILLKLEELIPQARLAVILDSVNAVYRSGRVSWAKKFLVSSLTIKPIVNFEKGLIVPGGTLFGKKEVLKRLKFLLPIILDKAITDTIFIWHVRYPEGAKELYDEAQKFNIHKKQVVIQEAGPVVGTHVGEKSIGFMYIGPYESKWLSKMKK